MSVLVKICGVRSFDAAQAAIDAGADFIGLNFVPASHRLVNLDKALDIVTNLRGKIKFVGVFQNQDPDFVNSISETFHLDYVQLHGDENENYILKLNSNVIKTFSLNDEDIETKMHKLSVNYFLIDREVQGEGEMVNKLLAKNLSEKFKIILAGGLTPENISEYIRDVNPIAVDVASGIETEGEQDLEKIKLFIERAKSL